MEPTRRPPSPEIPTLLSSLVDGVFDFSLEGPEGQTSRGQTPLVAGGRAELVPVTPMWVLGIWTSVLYWDPNCAVTCLAN